MPLVRAQHPRGSLHPAWRWGGRAWLHGWAGVFAAVPAPTKTRNHRRLCALASLIWACCSLGTATAAVETWGGNSSVNFSDSLNWSGSNPTPLSGDAWVFGAAGSSGLTLNNDLTALNAVAGITFNSGASAFTLGGNAITLTGNVLNSSTVLETINTAIDTTAVRTFTTTTAGGNIALGGVLSGAGGITVDTTFTGATTGTGVVTLSGTNTYSGATKVSGGTLLLKNSEALGNSTSISIAPSVNDRAHDSILQLESGVTITGKTLTFATQTTARGDLFGGTIAGSSGWDGDIINTGVTSVFFSAVAGNLTIGGATIDNRTLTLGGTGVDIRGNTTSNVVTINSRITGATSNTFQQISGGMVINSANNDFTVPSVLIYGTTTIKSIADQGTNSSLGKGTAVVAGVQKISLGSQASTGTLIYAGTGITDGTTNRVLDLGGGAGGAILDQSGTGLFKFTANLTATGAGAKTLTLKGSTAGTGEISGIILDNATVGSTQLNSAFAAAASTITLASVTGVSVGATISGTGIAGGTTITAINTATRVVTLSTPTTATGAVAQTMTVTGVTNPTALTKSGTGTWTLSGANTYSGATTVSGGVLNIQNATALGSVANGTTVASGAALQLQGGITVGAESLMLSGTGVSNDGALRSISGNNTFGGLLTLGAATRINSDTAGNTLTLSNTGTITGATFGLTVGGAGNTAIAGILGTTTGTLTKDGTGTLTLSGANTYTGSTTVSAGMAQFATTASLYTGNTANWTAAKLNVKSGATLAFNVGGTGEFATSDVTTLLTNLAASSSATNGMNAGATLGFDTSNATGGSFTLADNLADTTGASGGARGLTKLGTGTLVVSGTNS